MSLKQIWIGLLFFVIVWAFSFAQAETVKKPVCYVGESTYSYYDYDKNTPVFMTVYHILIHGQIFGASDYQDRGHAIEQIEKWVQSGFCDFESRRHYDETTQL